MEIEFKFAVEGSEAFDALVSALGLGSIVSYPAVRQANHFFDTEASDLRRNGLTLRLRLEGERTFLTAKGSDRRGEEQGILTRRLELEFVLEQDQGRALLAGEADPLALLAERAEPTTENAEDERILDLLRAASASQTLRPVGCFENDRIRLPATRLPGLATVKQEEEGNLVFELDRTRFPGDRIDWEIEVEIPSEADAESVHSALLALFERADIAWKRAPSKARRFFSILEEAGS